MSLKATFKMSGEGKIFLTARWENLILLTYRVPPEQLNPYLPKGLEADTIDDSAFVSLVAFDFLDTKVKGVKVPFHINFPEINLRAYVKHKEKRGVIFIREFVPRFFVSLIANTVYNEKYRSAPMKNRVVKNGTVQASHSIKIQGNEYSVKIDAENKPFMPPEDTKEHFFKEHEWGFGTNRKNKLLIYKVEHPFWEIYPVIKFEHNFDFGEIYGKNWESLNHEKPCNVLFAKGSKIRVFKGSVIE